LTNRLREIQQEEKEICPSQQLLRENWMELADIEPDLLEDQQYSTLIDRTYNWHEQRNSFEQNQIEAMNGWLDQQREIANECL